MTEGRREKRVSNLIKEELARFFIEEMQGQAPGFITVTRVEITKDLMSAHVFLSIFGDSEKQSFLELLEKRKGYIRKYLASCVKLRYNPQLFFSLDPIPEYEEKLDRLIETAKKHES